MRSLQTNDEQANRLRQILFPRKQKGQLKCTSSSQISQTKQNEYREVNIIKTENVSQNLRKQITKLKQSIQNFMSKQNNSFGDNYLKTPRECLELIKFMSQGMVNYNAEIQEAAITLIQSFPKTNNRGMLSSKYFVMVLKLSYISNVYSCCKRRKISSGFHCIKTYSAQIKIRRDEQHLKHEVKQNKLYSLILRKVYKAFSRWRINSYSLQKSDIQSYYKSAIIERTLNQLKVLSDQSRMVIYLQQLLNTNADHLEILVLDCQKKMLRAYKVDSQILNHHFESVHNQSCFSLGNNQSQSFLQFLGNQKIKRIQIPLQHSLTKICVVKKQTLVIQDTRKDLDYSSQVDDYTVFYDFSARQNTQGSIFIPIINKKNNCIGVIRMYFYGKTVGQIPNSQILTTIAQSLDHCVKTSQIFHDSKSKYCLIKNAHYLKAIKFINQVQHYQIIGTQEQNYLLSVLKDSFYIKLIGKFSFKSLQTPCRTPQVVISEQFDINQLMGSNNTNQTKYQDFDKKIRLSNAVSIINKMKQTDSFFMYENRLLYLCLPGQLYIFENQGNCELNKNFNKDDGEKKYLPSSSLISESILRQLLLRMQQQKQKKQKNYALMLKKKKTQQQNMRIAKQQQKVQKMLDFCLKCPDVSNQQQILSIVNKYLKKFSENYENRAQIVYKNKKKVGINQSANSHILFQNQLIEISVPIEQILTLPTSQQAWKQFEKIEKPLKKLLQSKTRKFFESCFSPNLQVLEMKAELFFKKYSKQQAFIKLMQDIFQMAEGECKLIQCQSNPFKLRSFLIHLESNQNIDSPQNLQRALRNFDILKLDPLSKKITILGYEDCKNLKVIQLNKYCHVQQDNVEKIFKIYNKWNIQETIITKLQDSFALNEKLIKLVVKIQKIAVKSIKHSFYQIKYANSANIKIDRLCIDRWMNRQNRKLVSHSFMVMKEFNRVKRDQNLYNWESKIRNVIIQVMKVNSTSKIFQIYKETKNKEKKLNSCLSIIEIMKNRVLYQSFHSIYVCSAVPKINKLFNVQNYLRAVLSPAFKKIKRQSDKKAIFNIISDETQCSHISKLNSLIDINSILRKKFSDFIVLLRSHNGKFFQLGQALVNFQSQFKQRSGYQFLQFTMQPTKSNLSSIVWLIPQSVTPSLVQKHYLQVLSKAIEEGFLKFMSKCKQILTFLDVYYLLKQKQALKTAMSCLKSKAISEIKASSYGLRDKYYQITVELQNCKQLQAEQKKQEQQRMEQVRNNIIFCESLQQELNEARKSNVRFEVMSRKLQQIHNRSRAEKERSDILRLFKMWRVEAFYVKKYLERRVLARKKPLFRCNVLFKVVSWKIKENLLFSFKRMILNSANKRARQLSTCSKKQSNQVRCVTNNRLLTFQDQLNEEGLNDKRNTQANNMKNVLIEKEQHELSIIPISFKHYQIRQQNKQNYDITDEEAKKLNGGAYKLNTKTLKFLKRMGKLNS